jgi:osmoprotectant transport system ATP-binding protein
MHRTAPGPSRGRAVALSAQGVVHDYGGVTALEGVSVAVGPGRCVALVGESGSGKTTLLRCFNRMVAPRAGRVTIDGEPVERHAPEQLRRRIGYVPQQGGLLPHWRVLRNVALVPSLCGMPDPVAAAEEALGLVGLPVMRFGARFPHELSGGQRQRVALARALAARPGVLLLDEPFGALDAISRGDLLETFDAVRRMVGVTTLLVTHDLAEAARLADEVAVMRAGRIEQCAPMNVMLRAPGTGYVAALLARAMASSALTRLPT